DRGLAVLGHLVELAERSLHQIEPDAHLGDGLLVAGDRRKLRAQPDGEAAVEAETRIARRPLARSELALQIVKLRAHVADRLQRECGSSANSGNRHCGLRLSSAYRTFP